MSKPHLRAVVAYVGFPLFSCGENWCAKCKSCGQVLTKYAFTRDEALSEATEETCRCKAA